MSQKEGRIEGAVGCRGESLRLGGRGVSGSEWESSLEVAIPPGKTGGAPRGMRCP